MAEDDKTEFNSNVATLQRVDALIRNCIMASHEEDVKAWYRNLLNLRREAIVKMDKKTKEECEVAVRKLKKGFALHPRHNSNQKYHEVLMDELDRFDIFIRQFLEEKGMLLRDMEDDGL